MLVVVDVIFSPSLLPLSAAPASTKTLCCVRKRPLLQKELDLRDYDVFSASSDLSSISIRSDVGGTPSDGGGTGGVGGGRNNSDADGGGDGKVPHVAVHAHVRESVCVVSRS